MQAISQVIVFDPFFRQRAAPGTDCVSFNRPVHTAVAALTGDTVADRKPDPSRAEHKEAVRLSWKARHMPVGTLLAQPSVGRLFSAVLMVIFLKGHIIPSPNRRFEWSRERLPGLLPPLLRVFITSALGFESIAQSVRDGL